MLRTQSVPVTDTSSMVGASELSSLVESDHAVQEDVQSTTKEVTAVAVEEIVEVTTAEVVVVAAAEDHKEEPDTESSLKDFHQLAHGKILKITCVRLETSAMLMSPATVLESLSSLVTMT